MAVALTEIATSPDASRRYIMKEYSMVFSGSYTQTGDPIDFSAATKTFGQRVPNGAPESIEIIGNPGGTPAEPVVGTTNANSKIKLFSSPNTELAAGAYNAAVTGDTNCRVRARWKKQLA